MPIWREDRIWECGGWEGVQLGGEGVCVPPGLSQLPVCFLRWPWVFFSPLPPHHCLYQLTPCDYSSCRVGGGTKETSLCPTPPHPCLDLGLDEEAVHQAEVSASTFPSLAWLLWWEEEGAGRKRTQQVRDAGGAPCSL